MKKVVMFIPKIMLVVVFLIMILISALFGYFYIFCSSSRVEGISNYDHCYKSEYFKSDDSSLIFEKVYYKKYSSIRIPSNSVGTNEKIIREFMDKALNKLHELDNTMDVEFNNDSITSDDYYRYYKDGEYVGLTYYDNDDMILYNIKILK